MLPYDMAGPADVAALGRPLSILVSRQLCLLLVPYSGEPVQGVAEGVPSAPNLHANLRLPALAVMQAPACQKVVEFWAHTLATTGTTSQAHASSCLSQQFGPDHTATESTLFCHTGLGPHHHDAK
jgi:hypothetical protein